MNYRENESEINFFIDAIHGHRDSVFKKFALFCLKFAKK